MTKLLDLPLLTEVFLTTKSSSKSHFTVVVLVVHVVLVVLVVLVVRNLTFRQSASRFFRACLHLLQESITVSRIKGEKRF